MGYRCAVIGDPDPGQATFRRIAIARSRFRDLPTPETDEAEIALDKAGRYLDANPPALELLGVSLAELRASPPDRFAVHATDDDERAALRNLWETRGTHALIGTAGIRRADGTTVRISYAIEATDFGFRAMVRRIEGSPEAPPTIFSVGDVLREWRAAERELAHLVPGTPEWDRALGEVDLLRGHYQELFRSVAQSHDRQR